VITSPYDKLSVTLSYRHDVNGSHDSGIWSPSISYATPLSRYNAVSLVGSANRVESGYARTYFSVTPAQAAASGLPVYTARGGWKDYSISLLGTQAITGDLLHGLKLVGGGIYRRLLNDFGDSPITTRKSQWTGALGLAYTF
jgi:MipA family protein